MKIHFPNITGSAASLNGFTGSLLGTASYATTASFALNGGGGGSGGDFVTSSWTGSSTSQFSGTASFATIASSLRTGSSTIIGSGTSLNISTPRLFLTGSVLTTIFGNNGIDLIGSITSAGNINPDGPYVNDISSYDLGQLSKVWDNLFVSNMRFVSGGTTASIHFNDGNITFTGSTVLLPPGSISPTASLADTASFSISASRANTASLASTITVSNDAAPTSRYVPFVSNVAVGLATPTNNVLTNANFVYTPANNTLSTTSSWATNATSASLADVSLLSPTPTFLSYSSTPTASALTALQNVGLDPVQSRAGFIFPSTGFYYFEFSITYQSALTTTGALFSLSGSANLSYLSCTVTYPTLATDRSTTYFTSYNGGSASPSTLAASPTAVAALITGHARVVTTGSIFIRFATEIAGSAITFITNSIMYRKISN